MERLQKMTNARKHLKVNKYSRR